MKVVFLQDVAKVGKKGEVKDVNQGHAMNFLIPRKLVSPVSDADVKNIQAQKEKQEDENEVQKELAIKDIISLKGKKVSIKEKANEQGHLFSQVHKDEIQQAVKDQYGVNLKIDSINLNDPIKETGEFPVTLSLYDKESEIILSIEPA